MQLETFVASLTLFGIVLQIGGYIICSAEDAMGVDSSPRMYQYGQIMEQKGAQLFFYSLSFLIPYMWH
jgi:hypothetical protein